MLPAQSLGSSPHGLVRLQRLAGNRAISQRMEMTGASSADDLLRRTPAGHADSPGLIQRGKGKKNPNPKDKQGQRKYTYGSANTVPHVETYPGGAHLKIADPERGNKPKRYNIRIGNRPAAGAADAVAAAAANGDADLIAAVAAELR